MGPRRVQDVLFPPFLGRMQDKAGDCVNQRLRRTCPPCQLAQTQQPVHVHPDTSHAGDVSRWACLSHGDTPWMGVRLSKGILLIAL